MPFDLLSLAHALDAQDTLGHCRDLFLIPKHTSGRDAIYLCGNSLGLQPKSTRSYINAELDDWERLGVDGHQHAHHPWLPYHEFLTEQTARLVGAHPSEVVTMNSLTVNIHLLLVSFYRPSGARTKIVIEKGAFPSDRYAVLSHIAWHGLDESTALVELTPRAGEDILRTEDIEEFLEREGSTVATVMLGGVNYYSGQAFDMGRIAAAGHRAGCVVGFDLAHAAGNLVLKLHEWNVDFAAWCSYKYLNAGPGAVAGCFVHEHHARAFDRPRFAGWWSQNKTTRFAMPPSYDPLPGAEGWQISNPPIFQLAALRASLDIFDDVGMPALRAKSERLTAFLEECVLERARSSGRERVTIITPSDPSQRGCQLSLRTGANGRAIYTHLETRGVVCDWREPDVIRVAPVPLYNSFADVAEFSELLYAS
jgi:kynureninase